ncbi:gliotoxin biosynthesis protein GliK [Trichophyton verrucosum HKI 0517]|uniref:Gliotoxin biosynthesis protein GliK n=1 Tax=Trichophyton verrucosum (strain HKI 0517) TaxID=663202 RepID=D4DFW7_TRIVH|nr:gliotoxin biosynthesis protein GliK [Trichophyton verrucosum HKI 0517]EFE39248.1 gliotoxin biosynthesis protein GliK [Trichophyton verrucosum HKI 0517]
MFVSPSPLPKAEAAKERLVWYLAYGSNLSAKTFREDRGMTPQAAVAVKVAGWRLAMSSAGFPYREPCYASITEYKPATEKIVENGVDDDEVLCGTAYLITWAQWIEIIGSEGGGIAYDEALVAAQPVHPAHRQRWGDQIRVLTLVSTMERWPEARPTERYLVSLIISFFPPFLSVSKSWRSTQNKLTFLPPRSRSFKGLILDGAQAANFPPSYIERIRQKYPCYQPPSTAWERMGAAIFLAFWTPVMSLLSTLTHSTARTGPGKDGHVPPAVRALVRFAMLAMWWLHDTIWAGIWGRGDGLDQ